MLSNISLEIDDGKDGSYIHVVHSRPAVPPNSPSHTMALSTPNELESSASYDEPKNWTVQKGSNLYLTLIHDSPKRPTYTENGTPKDCPPPTVPAHRKRYVLYTLCITIVFYNTLEGFSNTIVQ